MSGGGDIFLPYGRQSIDEDDIAAVVSVLRGDFLTTGPAVGAFEKRLAGVTGARHAVACNSGTAALHLACAALGLGAGDVAIVPAVTFLATANAARYMEAEVVFADVDPDNGLMTPETLDAALARAATEFPGHAAKACLPVHLSGQSADMAAIGAVAVRAGLAVIEDACHAIGGADANGAAIGACAHSAMACFSGHPVKSFAMGEGGAITTNDDRLAERLARLRSHGMVRDPALFRQKDDAFDEGAIANPWYYEMPEIGFNYRASDLNCALGESQLAKLGAFVAARRELAETYFELLGPLAPVVQPIARTEGRPAWHLMSVLIDFERANRGRAAVMTELRAAGIGTQVHYIPVNRQPYYRERYGDRRLPGADAYYARTLSLPLFVGMTRTDVAHVVTHLAAALGLTP